MHTTTPTPGIVISHEDDAVVVRIGRDFATPMMSILLHSKFADGPRMDFLTSPHTNALIEALMTANGLTDYMAQREGMAKALVPVTQLVDDEVRRQDMPAEEAAALLRSAIYPYNLT